MDLGYPAPADEFLCRVKDFTRWLAPRVNEMESRACVPPEVMRECGRRGLTGMLVPSSFGGSDVGAVGYVLAIEEISRVCASLGTVLSVHNSVGALPIALFGTTAQKIELLPPLCAGEKLAGFAITEAGAGSDVSSISTNAVISGDHFVLNGIKIFISNGNGDIFNILAATEPGKGSYGMTMFIACKGDIGFRVGTAEQKMGIHADETCELVLENCTLPKSRILGELNAGFKIAMKVLDIGRIGISAQAVGAARGALEEAICIVQKNKHHGMQQHIQFAIAECATELDAARLLMLKAADRKSRGEPTTVVASMAKSYATTIANRIAMRLPRLFGPETMISKNSIERFFRDSKVFEIYEGTTEIHNLVISRRLLGNIPWERRLD